MEPEVHSPEPTEWVSGNIMIRPMKFPYRGARIPFHKHNYGHTGIVHTGAIRVTASRDGLTRQQDFYAPAHFYVEADAEHELVDIRPTMREALCNWKLFKWWLADCLTGRVKDTWCVYSHRTPQGEVIQENIGWLPAYGWNPPNV